MENSVAEVMAVMPKKIKIAVSDIRNFNKTGEKFSVGSYIRISDTEECAIIGMIENFVIENDEKNGRKYILEAVPLGFLDENNCFTRGGNNIAIPPTGVRPASEEEIQTIFHKMEPDKRFSFSKLLKNNRIDTPVDGDKFFSKHFAIVGSTGSGKSHTVAKLFQEVREKKNSEYTGLNNSHIILFDIHSEYKSAFSDCNYIDVSNLQLPYWLMNGEELEELLVETGENQAYNQVSLLRRLITINKIKNNNNKPDISFDTTVRFSIEEVLNAIINLSKETRNAKNSSEVASKPEKKIYINDDVKYNDYFKSIIEFEEQKPQNISKGIYNDGSLEKLISRITSKMKDQRLSFLFGNESVNNNLMNVLKKLLGYSDNNEKNITIIDLSGVPFEVLSITVSLISRILFEAAYYLKKIHINDCVCPLLLVYEEAHKYVPKIRDAKYNSSRLAIERIAKEGRKYGITLGIVSQRPSEISETIFSQCGNFIIMRLTNPQDQNYVQRLLPDSLGEITDSLPILGSGQGLIVGDAIIMPSVVAIDKCSPEPNSNDINYYQEWKKSWRDIEFGKVIEKYEK